MDSYEINKEIRKYFGAWTINLNDSAWLSLFPIIQDCRDNGYYKISKWHFEWQLPKIIQILIDNNEIDNDDIYMESADYNVFYKNIGEDGYIYITFGNYIIDTIDVFWSYKGTMPKGRRFKVLERDGFKCGYCGITKNETELHVDHILPRKYGGRNDMDNLITACIPCNLGKSDRIINMEGVKHVLTKSRTSNDSI